MLTDQQYEFLTDESRRSSVSLGELVRRAIDTTYDPGGMRFVHVITHTLGRRAGVPFSDYALSEDWDAPSSPSQ